MGLALIIVTTKGMVRAGVKQKTQEITVVYRIAPMVNLPLNKTISKQL